jgi:three-Cys-motif partner protein
MDVPKQYEGREQSFLKHRVLEEYLLVWGLKLGSLSQRRQVRLCYVDGFAGPWKARSDALEDTSIAIGLAALEAAAKVWRDKGARIEAEAFFVEKEAGPFKELEQYLSNRSGIVRTTAKNGEFGALVPEIKRWLGTDAGLIFVDPTGWKGAAMHFIAPLVAGTSRRDVLVNVMFDHINRFKDDERAFLRRQMSDFFGLGAKELPEGLAEDELFASRSRTRPWTERSSDLSSAARAPRSSSSLETSSVRSSAARRRLSAMTPRHGAVSSSRGR